MGKTFFTVGPTQLHPVVKSAITEALRKDILSVSHRSETFRNIYSSLVVKMRELLNLPEEYRLFFMGSSTEAMERIIQNCVRRKSYHFVNGSFSGRFYESSVSLGIDAYVYKVPFGKGFDFNGMSLPEDADVICITQNETSTGVQIPVSEVRALRNKNQNKIMAMDVVSSVPCIEMDYTLADVFFFSVQKCFGLPPGLAVLFVNERAIEKSARISASGRYTGGFRSFVKMNELAAKYQTPETPNILNIFLLLRVVESMLREGKEKIINSCREKAEILYEFFEKDELFHPFVENMEIRSDTILVINTRESSEEIISELMKKGLVIGKGYRALNREQIRIANFPAHGMHDIQRLLHALNEYIGKGR